VADASACPADAVAGDSRAVLGVRRGSYHLHQGIGPFIGNVIMGVIFGTLVHAVADLAALGAKIVRDLPRILTLNPAHNSNRRPLRRMWLEVLSPDPPPADCTGTQPVLR